MSKAIIWAVIGLCAMPFGAHAKTQESQAGCTAPVSLPAEMKSWKNPIVGIASVSGEPLQFLQLILNQAAKVSLFPRPKVEYSVVPGKSGGPESYGGLLTFSVEQRGTYRIALGSPAWLDVVSRNGAAASTAHGHGPACSGIRKMVDFPLESGNYTLQIAASDQPETTVLIIRIP